jgi:hypothetical protein
MKVQLSMMPFWVGKRTEKGAQKSMTDEQKAKVREQVRMRQRKRRALLKEQGEIEKMGSKPVKKRTRNEKLKIRIKWRDSKREYRQKLHPQKKRRIKEQNIAAHPIVRKEHSETTERRKKTKTTEGPEVGSPFPSQHAERKAIARSASKITKDADRHVAILAGLLRRCQRCPRKRAALEKYQELVDRSRSTRHARRQLLYKTVFHSAKETIQRLKASCNNKARMERRMLLAGITRNIKAFYGRTIKKVEISRNIGVRPEYFNSVVENPEPRSRKTRKDAITEETQKLVEAFYHDPNVSREIPDSKRKSKRFVLECILKRAYDTFIQENPGIKIKISKFITLRPLDVLVQSKIPHIQCLCEVCANTDLRLSQGKLTKPCTVLKYRTDTPLPKRRCA